MQNEEILKYVISLLDYFGYDYNISLVVPSIILIKYLWELAYNYYKKTRNFAEVTLSSNDVIADLNERLNEATQKIKDMEKEISLLNGKVDVLTDLIKE